MADSDRITFPEEVADAKADAVEEASKTEGGDTNTIEETPAQPAVAMRNMISVPSNCPPGYKMGADGNTTTETRRNCQRCQPIPAVYTKLSGSKCRKTEDKKQGVDVPVLYRRKITKRNVITVPANCLDGKQLDIKGVCRLVFD